MQLTKEPKGIPEHIRLSTLPKIYSVTPYFEIIIVIDDPRYFFRVWHYRKYKYPKWDTRCTDPKKGIKLVRMHGPPVSDFLDNEVYCSALLNIDNAELLDRKTPLTAV